MARNTDNIRKAKKKKKKKKKALATKIKKRLVITSTVSRNCGVMQT
jgi:hypothetical protein